MTTTPITRFTQDQQVTQCSYLISGRAPSCESKPATEYQSPKIPVPLGLGASALLVTAAAFRVRSTKV